MIERESHDATWNSEWRRKTRSKRFGKAEGLRVSRTNGLSKERQESRGAFQVKRIDEVEWEEVGSLSL